MEQQRRGPHRRGGQVPRLLHPRDRGVELRLQLADLLLEARHDVLVHLLHHGLGALDPGQVGRLACAVQAGWRPRCADRRGGRSACAARATGARCRRRRARRAARPTHRPEAPRAREGASTRGRARRASVRARVCRRRGSGGWRAGGGWDGTSGSSHHKTHETQLSARRHAVRMQLKSQMPPLLPIQQLHSRMQRKSAGARAPRA